MSDDEPKAQATEYPGACPKCGQSPVVLVSIGDPEAAKESSVSKTEVATVTVATHYAFLSCHGCKHSWDLPKTGSS